MENFLKGNYSGVKVVFSAEIIDLILRRIHTLAIYFILEIFLQMKLDISLKCCRHKCVQTPCPCIGVKEVCRAEVGHNKQIVSNKQQTPSSPRPSQHVAPTGHTGFVSPIAVLTTRRVAT